MLDLTRLCRSNRRTQISEAEHKQGRLSCSLCISLVGCWGAVPQSLWNQAGQGDRSPVAVPWCFPVDDKQKEAGWGLSLLFTSHVASLGSYNLSARSCLCPTCPFSCLLVCDDFFVRWNWILSLPDSPSYISCPKIFVSCVRSLFHVTLYHAEV